MNKLTQQSDEQFYQEIEELILNATIKKPSPLLNLPSKVSKRVPLFLDVRVERRVNIQTLKLEFESPVRPDEEQKIKYNTPIGKKQCRNGASTRVKWADDSNTKNVYEMTDQKIAQHVTKRVLFEYLD